MKINNLSAKQLDRKFQDPLIDAFNKPARQAYTVRHQGVALA